MRINVYIPDWTEDRITREHLDIVLEDAHERDIYPICRVCGQPIMDESHELCVDCYMEDQIKKGVLQG